MQFQLIGVPENALDNVKHRLEYTQKHMLQQTNEKNVTAFYHLASSEIQQALQPYGYFHATVNSKLYKKNNLWFMVFYVKPGKPLRINQLNINVIGQGKNNPTIRSYIQHFPLETGDILTTVSYNNAKDGLVNVGVGCGYLKATYTIHEIQIDLKAYTAKIKLVLNTGPLYYFGPVTFSQTSLSDRFLQRFLPFKTGQPFSNDAVIQANNNLASSIYFKRVDIHADVDENLHNYIPVYVNLTPKKSQQYSLGVGYGTDTGARGKLGWEWRNVTPSGHYVQAIIQASQVLSNFQARYIIPGKNPILQHYSIFAGVITNEPGYGEYTNYQFGGNYVTDFGDWETIIALTYQHERFFVNPQSPTFTTDYIVPNVSIEKVTADNRVNTRNGYRIYLNTQAGTATNTNSVFLQTELQAKFIKTFFERNRILLRTDLGFTSVHNLDQFPLSLQFFAGGAQSVRGYAFQGLGPGKYLIVGSAEYQFRIYGKWSIATFYDAGNAFNNTPISLQKSYGAGIVYHSAMGPVSLTVAHPIGGDNDNYFKSLRVQFIIGPDL